MHAEQSWKRVMPLVVVSLAFAAAAGAQAPDAARLKQEALQARNEKVKRVTQAEAAYQEQKLAADAAAYDIEARSKAKADAIAREAKALKDNPQLIQLRLSEKWDGTLPKFTGGEAIPFIDINSVINDKQ